MIDGRTQGLGSLRPDTLPPRVQEGFKSALSKEVSAGPGPGGQFGDCTDGQAFEAQFGDSAQFGDIAV
jgi:hypothetical protein